MLFWVDRLFFLQAKTFLLPHHSYVERYSASALRIIVVVVEKEEARPNGVVPCCTAPSSGPDPRRRRSRNADAVAVPAVDGGGPYRVATRVENHCRRLALLLPKTCQLLVVVVVVLMTAAAAGKNGPRDDAVVVSKTKRTREKEEEEEERTSSSPAPCLSARQVPSPPSPPSVLSPFASHTSTSWRTLGTKRP